MRKTRHLDLTDHRIWKDKNITFEAKDIYSYLYTEGFDRTIANVNIGSIIAIIITENKMVKPFIIIYGKELVKKLWITLVSLLNRFIKPPVVLELAEFNDNFWTFSYKLIRISLTIPFETTGSILPLIILIKTDTKYKHTNEIIKNKKLEL